jgi:hypothetical protein
VPGRKILQNFLAITTVIYDWKCFWFFLYQCIRAKVHFRYTFYFSGKIRVSAASRIIWYPNYWCGSVRVPNEWIDFFLQINQIVRFKVSKLIRLRLQGTAKWCDSARIVLYSNKYGKFVESNTESVQNQSHQRDNSDADCPAHICSSLKKIIRLSGNFRFSQTKWNNVIMKEIHYFI